MSDTHPRSHFEHIDQVASRAARHGERAAMFAARRGVRGPCGPPLFFGLLFLAMGGLLLLNNLNIIEARPLIRTYWPAVIVAWGALRLIFGGGVGRGAGVLAIGVGGLLLANRIVGWGLNVWALFWPLVLMAIGLHVLFRGAMPRARWEGDVPATGAADGEAGADADTDLSSFIKLSAITANIARKNASQSLVGGAITVALGSLELDLRECRIAGATADLVVTVNVGNLEILVPKDWVIESKLSPALANFEDRTERPIDPAARRLLISGYAFLGNVETRN